MLNIKLEKESPIFVNSFELRNVHGITSTTGAGFLFVFKTCQQAHSKLRNCWHNAEDGQKNKQVVEVISCTFLTSVKPIILAIALVSSVITILAIKQTYEVPSITTMSASRVIQCGKSYVIRGRARGTRRYFWRKDCPSGWHPV